MHSLKPLLQTLVTGRVSAKKRNSSGLCANGLILQSLVSLPMKRGEAVQTYQQLQFSFHANIDSCKFFSYSHPPTLSLSLSLSLSFSRLWGWERGFEGRPNCWMIHWIFFSWMWQFIAKLLRNTFDASSLKFKRPFINFFRVMKFHA